LVKYFYEPITHFVQLSEFPFLTLENEHITDKIPQSMPGSIKLLRILESEIGAYAGIRDGRWRDGVGPWFEYDIYIIINRLQYFLLPWLCLKLDF